MMKSLVCIQGLFLILNVYAQDDYDLAKIHFSSSSLDSARFYINRQLADKPRAEDYFLSGLINESQGNDLRALSDYEAVIQKEPANIEAYFQKGLIYFNTGSTEQAILDFTYVIDNHRGSETKAIYYAQDPTGGTGTFLTTLQTMISRVYQYRGMAHQKNGSWEKAIADFTTAFEFEKNVDCYINRSQLYVKMGREQDAIADLNEAIKLDSTSYSAWYNLIILDENARFPNELMDNEEFTPMLNLLGANAYQSEDFEGSIKYYTKAIEANPNDDLGFTGRGKAKLKIGDYGEARRDFIKAMQLEPTRKESLYLIGNSLYYEKRFQDAVGFYEQYLSIDREYGNVWFNAAMAYLSLEQKEKACNYLLKARGLGMQNANTILEKYCDNP